MPAVSEKEYDEQYNTWLFFSAKIVILMADSDVQKVLKAVVATRVSGRSKDWRITN